MKIFKQHKIMNKLRKFIPTLANNLVSFNLLLTAFFSLIFLCLFLNKMMYTILYPKMKKLMIIKIRTIIEFNMKLQI